MINERVGGLTATRSEIYGDYFLLAIQWCCAHMCVFMRGRDSEIQRLSFLHLCIHICVQMEAYKSIHVYRDNSVCVCVCVRESWEGVFINVKASSCV